MAYELENVTILNVKGADCRCFYGIWLKMMRLIC